jgi:hypothetical protein
MQEIRFELYESKEWGVAWKAARALAIGALLGLLVGIPYNRLFGLSPSICDVLRSLATTAAFTSLAVNRIDGLPAEAQRRLDARTEQVRAEAAMLDLPAGLTRFL